MPRTKFDVVHGLVKGLHICTLRSIFAALDSSLKLVVRRVFLLVMHEAVEHSNPLAVVVSEKNIHMEIGRQPMPTFYP